MRGKTKHARGVRERERQGATLGLVALSSVRHVALRSLTQVLKLDLDLLGPGELIVRLRTRTHTPPLSGHRADTGGCARRLWGASGPPWLSQSWPRRSWGAEDVKRRRPKDGNKERL